MKWSNRWLGVLSALWMALASCSGADPFAPTCAPITATRAPLPLLTHDPVRNSLYLVERKATRTRA